MLKATALREVHPCEVVPSLSTCAASSSQARQRICGKTGSQNMPSAAFRNHVSRAAAIHRLLQTMTTPRHDRVRHSLLVRGRIVAPRIADDAARRQTLVRCLTDSALLIPVRRTAESSCGATFMSKTASTTRLSNNHCMFRRTTA